MIRRLPLVLHTIVLAGLPCLAAAPRPRIFITRADLPRLRARALDTRTNALGHVPATAWQTLKERADHFAAAPPYHYAVNMPGREGGPPKRWEYTLSNEPPPRHDDFRHYPPWTAMFQERSDSITTRLRFLLLAWMVTDDAKYFGRAKHIVLTLCAWPGVWTDPSYGGGRPCLDTGHAAAWVGIFYDWCHARLTPAERTAVRTALIDKALAPIDAMMDKVSPYHNYTAVVATGLCVGAIALLGEDDRAQGWIDHAIARARLNFDAQGTDGGALEGPMYGTYAANSFADMFWALDSAKLPNPLLEHTYIRTLPRYCISLLNPGSQEQPCFGDGGPSRGFGPLMRVLALRGDAEAAWYCAQIGALDPGTPRGFIALDPARLQPRQPTRNPSGCFVDIGYAILRDGYKPGSAFLALKCGPPTKWVGHNHFDHNSFVIHYARTWIATDPGYRSYFNPPLRKYTVSTLGHNSIVLDLDDAYLANKAVCLAGHDQVSLTKGRIREFFTSPRFDYVLGDAAAAYNTKTVRVLDRFDRQIVFVKPNVFFVRDTLAAPKAHAYSFLLHVGPGEFEIEADHARAVGSQCVLQTHVYSPAGIRFSTAVYPGAESKGPYLAATTGQAKATTITSVLVPRRSRHLVVNPGFEKGTLGWKPRNMPGFVENHVIDSDVKHRGTASARIDTGGYYYSSRFSLPAGTTIRARWWARCTAADGAESILYYWRGNKSFARTLGPVATVNEWRQYELIDAVPKGAESVCLALQFFGKGQCWYDDVEIEAEPEVPDSTPATVAPLSGGADGAICEVDGLSHIFLCGKAGQARAVQAAGHTIATDAEIAVVSLGEGEPRAFLLRGTSIQLDGTPLGKGDILLFPPSCQPK